ncbi:Plant self-incompatibility protein S1 family [Raphanus sativus]|uniref:S-protein homolog n=1 Tax=Raphanus sativus TaxID=3726 RepID=A0A6J0N849_RAPSA|nr:S-protein homolog 9-like [Raphanus sativus]KAJ4904416.1 Plant self-incompatibility protein S1 family [Raphanus sativus]
MNNLLIVLILLGLCISLSNGFRMLGGSTVTLSNQLEHNKLLKVRCNNDEGEQIVKIGEEYEFTFGDNFLGTTLYSCKLDQGPNFKHHQEFVAYDATWSKALEVTCKWIAREDGIYFSLDGNSPLRRYEWDGPHLFIN